ncbi:MAG: TRAP transporter large permease subunit, partial [Gammaproteobacteria bacterium]|nr:TRAP transporter large permease subunit [Gammaproteobacteria bacterium]
IENPWVFLLALNCVLLVIGCFMDIFSAIVVLVPLIVPLGQVFGIHPVHLGLVFLANLELGYLTPPVGMNLFFAATRFERPVLEIYRAVVPLFLLLSLGVLLITYVPFLSTALPALLR